MKKIKRVMLLLLVVFVIFLATVYFQNSWLQVSSYTITSSKVPEAFNGYKIVQLSDLHSSEFGSDNEKLIRKIRAIKPDIIITTGDMKNSVNDNGQVFLALLKQLARQYPVYYVSGNHEQIAEYKTPKEYQAYMERIRQLGVVVMDDHTVKITAAGESINLHGLILPLRYYKAKNTATYVGEKPFSKAFIEQAIGKPDPGSFTLLMTHNPLYFDVYADWGADLTLTGHMHGGVIRIPFMGGLLSPERSFFPHYDAGKFVIQQDTREAALIINRGMGTETVDVKGINVTLPRVFNRPDITVIELRNK